MGGVILSTPKRKEYTSYKKRAYGLDVQVVVGLTFCY